MLESFIPLFNSAAHRMVNDISKEFSDGSSFDIHKYLEKCVVELVCAATFDVHLADEKEGEAMAKLIVETANT